MSHLVEVVVRACGHEEGVSGCVIRPKPATQSGQNRPPNPAETGHPIRPKPATRSG